MGIDAYLVQVEVDIATGLPGFCMVGSLGTEVKEARERVQVALRNLGFDLPPMKITVNLAPANRRKEGTAYDLPIAVGTLASAGYFEVRNTEDILFIGELGLDGEIRPVRGVLPIVREAAKSGIRCCIVPKQNEREGAMITDIEVHGADDLRSVVRFLREKQKIRNQILPVAEPGELIPNSQDCDFGGIDFSDVCGQDGAKRAAEIAAGGFHTLLLIGPPGSGKSMIAKRIPKIMPPLSREEGMEVASVYSVAGVLKDSRPFIKERPFQNPHHTVTQAAMTGGGLIPRPGIMSLSHRGVLFLDELPEFSRTTLDCMRQPLEDHEVHVARTYGNITYPADFMLVCAMNPCVCGYYPDRNRCRCTDAEVRRYLSKVSGPILDRIDLCMEVLPVNVGRLHREGVQETSAEIRKRVMRARDMQEERFRGTNYHFNSQIEAAKMDQYCPLGAKEQQLMEQAYETLKLSARGYHRILRVARTIADLSGEERISEVHLMEAIGYRINDRLYWGSNSGYICV